MNRSPRLRAADLMAGHLVAAGLLAVGLLGSVSACDRSPSTPQPVVAVPDAVVDAALGDATAPADPAPQRTADDDLMGPPDRLPDSTLEARLHRRAGRLGMARAAFEEGWSAHRRPEVALIVAVLYQRAGDHRAALRWFDRSPIPELADFIAFRTLRSASALGDADRALFAAEQVSAQSRFASPAMVQAAEALIDAGRPADAADWLQARAPGRMRVDPEVMALRARALQAAGRAADAVRAWRRVELRIGSKSRRTRAQRALRQLRWTMPRARWRSLQAGADAHVLAGLAELDAHAYAALEARMLGALRRGIPVAAIECDTWWLLARARTKLRRHGDAAPAYGRFATACRHHPWAVRAAYAQARALFSDDDADAALRAARVAWRDWPAHRLADDARLLAARIHQARGETAEALDQLRALVWHHPNADVVSDAAWLMRALGGAPRASDARDRAHLGRLAYFEGVDLLTAGQVGRAEAQLTRVRARTPNGYYGLLAWNRLRIAGLPRPRTVPRWPRPALDARSGWTEGLLLLELGFVQDAWWAFDDAGPGSMEAGRYQAELARLFDAHGHEAMAQRMFERDVPHLDGLPLDADTLRWFDAVYPIEHLEIFERWSQARALPVTLLLALAHTESRFNARARSWAGACGIMQMVPTTATEVARSEGIRGRVSCRRLRDVELSVRLASRYLADLRDRFGPHPGVLAAAYNAGPGNVSGWIDDPRPPFDQWVEALPFHQARRYVKRVLAAMAVYSTRRTGALPEIDFDW